MILKLIRKNIKRMMWALVILIIPVFVLWGVGGAVRGRRTPKYAGTIFGKRVSFEEYARSWQACKNQAIIVYGDRLNQVARYLDIDQEAWNHLILLKEVKRRGMSVGDKEVIETIKANPLFQKDGKFDQERYNFMLRHVFKTEPAAFEKDLRDTLLIWRLRMAILGRVTVTEEELRDQYEKENELVKVSYIPIEWKDFREDIEITEAELRDYHRRHGQEFERPEQVNVEYITISYADMEDKISVLREEMGKYYDSHLEEFKKGSEDKELTEPEEGSFYKPLNEVEEEIRKKLLFTKSRGYAEELSDRIADSLIDNPDLEAISKDYSLEMRETGYFAIDEWIPGIGWSYQLATIAFGLEVGQTYDDVIETQKGYYAIRLKEKRGPSIEFEEVKEKVKETLIAKRAKELARQKAEGYLSRLRQNDTKFEDIAQSLSLKVENTDFFTRKDYVPGIGRSPQFSKACFELNVGEISDVIETVKGYCILRLNEIKQINEEKFLQEKDEFRQKVLFRKGLEIYDKWFRELNKEANLQSNLKKKDN